MESVDDEPHSTLGVLVDMNPQCCGCFAHSGGGTLVVADIVRVEGRGRRRRRRGGGGHGVRRQGGAGGGGRVFFCVQVVGGVEVRRYGRDLGLSLRGGVRGGCLGGCAAGAAAAAAIPVALHNLGRCHCSAAIDIISSRLFRKIPVERSVCLLFRHWRTSEKMLYKYSFSIF